MPTASRYARHRDRDVRSFYRMGLRHAAGRTRPLSDAAARRLTTRLPMVCIAAYRAGFADLPHEARLEPAGRSTDG